jgi:hypothetical protein
MAVAKNGSSKFGTVSIGVDSKSRYHVFAGVNSISRFGEGTHIHGSCSLQIDELGWCGAGTEWGRDVDVGTQCANCAGDIGRSG